MVSEPTMSHEPTDRLTHLCDAMSHALEVHPESREGDKCIIFLDDGVRGGIVIHGYEDQSEAMVDLLIHMRAIFKANGKHLDFMFLGEDGIDRV